MDSAGTSPLQFNDSTSTSVEEPIFFGLGFSVGLVLCVALLRSRTLACIAYTLVISVLMAPLNELWQLEILIFTLAVALFIWILVRVGLLALTMALFAMSLALRFPITTDWQAWYGAIGIWAALLIGIIALLGAVASTNSYRPTIRKLLFEEDSTR